MNHLLDMVKMTVADGNPVYLYFDVFEGQPVECIDFEMDGHYTDVMDAETGGLKENAKEVLREVPFYLIEKMAACTVYGTEQAVDITIRENIAAIRDAKQEIDRLLDFIKEHEADIENLNASKTKQNRFLG